MGINKICYANPSKFSGSYIAAEQLAKMQLAKFANPLLLLENEHLNYFPTKFELEQDWLDDNGKKIKLEEELTMNLFGNFEIVKKDNGYVVKVQAEGEESEVVSDYYDEGVEEALNNVVREIERKRIVRDEKDREIEQLENKLEKLKK